MAHVRTWSAAIAAALLVAATGLAISSAAPRASSATPAADGAADPELAAFVRRFALNALLIPLLEADELPMRWADPEFTMACEAVEVRVDGHPVATGEELSGRAFAVRWRMRDCLPFGSDGPRLTGDAELSVHPGDDGIDAQVRLSGLHVERQGRFALLNESFSATAR